MGAGEFIPWSFELFSLGLDILLPKMTPETFKVIIPLSDPKREVEKADNGVGGRFRNQQPISHD